MTDLRMEDLLEIMSPAATPDIIFAKITHIAHRLGFEHCAYGMRTPLSFARKDILLFNDYPEAWRQRYSDNGYLEIDPTVLRGSRSLGGFTWESSHDPHDPAAGFWEDARRYGIAYGLSSATETPNRVRGMLTVSRGREKPGAGELEEISPFIAMLSQIAHQAMTRQVIEQATPNAEHMLSTRELDILRWIATGHTSADIADTYGITMSTVEFHVKNAAKKLGVKGRHAAIAQVSALGLLY